MKSDVVHRALLDELTAARERRGGELPRVLDVGGGSGVWSVPLASAGCTVTVVDPSPNALATLHRRAVDAGVGERISSVQGDTDALAGVAPVGGADLVLAHGLLEVVDDVAASTRALASAAAAGGAVSVLVVNRYATVLARALAGRPEEALRLLRAPEGHVDEASADPLLRRFDVDSLRAVLSGAGLGVQMLQGQRVVADLMPGSVSDGNTTAAEALDELEVAAADQPPLRDIATRLHAVARRPL